MLLKNNGKQIFLSFSKNNLSKIISAAYANPAQQELKDLLLKAAEFGVPAELLKLYAGSSDDRDRQIRRIVRRFAEKYNLVPESAEVSEAVSCFTFALDYGMFDYSVYPTNMAATKIIPAEIAEKQSYTELKDIDADISDEDGGESAFVDFKTWFGKKQIEENKLKDRDINKIYIKSEDNNYYELSETNHLMQSGTEFSELFKNFGPEKREREVIKMGIDICSELEERGSASVNPADIFRDKYGNYRLDKSIKTSDNKNNLGLFMRGLLGGDIKNEMLGIVIKKAGEDNKYNITEMKKTLEYAFETALEDLLFSGQTPPSVLTALKASANEFTNEDIQDMSVPDKYKAIGPRAFIRRENLRSVMIPDSIENIGGFAFGWCGNLENVTIEGGEDKNNIFDVGNFAFWGCENLRKVTMRGIFVKNIGDCAFYGCRKLKIDIYGDISGDAEELIDRVFYGTRDSDVNIYTDGKRKEKRYDRIFNNRVQFY